MNRREFLKKGLKILGIIAVAPFSIVPLATPRPDAKKIKEMPMIQGEIGCFEGSRFIETTDRHDFFLYGKTYEFNDELLETEPWYSINRESLIKQMRLTIDATIENIYEIV